MTKEGELEGLSGVKAGEMEFTLLLLRRRTCVSVIGAQRLFAEYNARGVEEWVRANPERSKA